jgi:hypothetical protein
VHVGAFVEIVEPDVAMPLPAVSDWMPSAAHTHAVPVHRER